MIRVVFDCVVLLQAAAYPNGPVGASFDSIRLQRAELLLSVDTLDEIENVLFRLTIRKKFKALTDEVAHRFLDDVYQLATFFDPVPAAFSYHRDPKDERYVNLAIAAKAKLLVTRDNDLLDIMNDLAFRQSYPDLTVLDPVTFLRTLPPEPGRAI